MAEELSSCLINVPAVTLHPRQSVSEAACHVAWQHWDAIRGLLSGNLFVSAAVLHRAQYEALVRSIWLLFCASDDQISKLWSRSSPEAERVGKDLPSAAEMLWGLREKAPKEAYDPLASFKDVSWRALN